MTSYYKDIRILTEEFETCQKILIALGDENRQHFMLEMMKMEQCGGVRVGTITEKNTSFPPGGVPPSSNTQRGRNFENAS